MKIGKAKPGDVPAIKGLIDLYSIDGKTVPRSLFELYSNIRDFWVCKEKGRLVGCCALHVTWSDLAEIKSLAVEKGHMGRGVGSALVKRCLKEAKKLGIPRVFALTGSPAFFEKCGFRRVAKSTLPIKVFGECLHCVKYPDCTEEAVIRDA